MTLRELYDQTIKPLPAGERLQIASFILSDITAAPVDVSDEWTDEDLRDATAASRRASKLQWGRQAMINPGDIVTYDFPGATGVKRRPAVVVSGDRYHIERPDVILGVLTTNIAAAITSTDYVLQDWAAAGLRRRSAFRAYLVMALPTSVDKIGKLSERDWKEVRARVALAFG